MLSFHNDKKIKSTYVRRVNAHIKADELIHGIYWEEGKGCAVGCTIHSQEHNRYEIELGLPEWLARLQDALFEGMVNGDSKNFVKNFLPAIPVGVNLEPVRWKFCAYLMRENIERVETLKISAALKKQVIDAIRCVLVLHEGAIERGTAPAWSAKSAAWSAKSAAWSAESAAWSAESAAWSAKSSL